MGFGLWGSGFRLYRWFATRLCMQGGDQVRDADGGGVEREGGGVGESARERVRAGESDGEREKGRAREREKGGRERD